MIELFLVVVVFLNAFSLRTVDGLCHLPHQWSGKWYQSKDIGDVSINRTHFLTRGICVEHKQDKFLFYESKEDCYRCVFIMQKHANVLQYRSTYCSDQNDFYANCQNLSPESELITVYRENAAGEKCPLNGLYVMTGQQQGRDESEQQRRAAAGTKCSDDESTTSSSRREKESMIMECSDQSMLKLQFGKCSSIPTFIINCIAHWTEGSTNYLIGRVEQQQQQQQQQQSNSSPNDPQSPKSTYKCIMYSELTNRNQHRIHQDQLRHIRQHKTAADFIDLASSNQNNGGGGETSNTNNIEIIEKSNLQLSISPDEFCRSIDSSMLLLDEQLSFTFSKVHGSRLLVAPPQMLARDHYMSKRKRDDLLKLNRSNTMTTTTSHTNNNNNNNYIIAHANCKFPKWLNRKWYNFKQTKSFQLDYRLDSLFVFDEKNAVIINKYTCTHMRSKRINHVQAVVKSLNGCSSGYQCLTINSKSDYVLEIKFGKISYESASSIDCNSEQRLHSDNDDDDEEDTTSDELASSYISREYVYVDTNYGVRCPLKSGIYEKLQSSSSSFSTASKHYSSPTSRHNNEYAMSASLIVADTQSQPQPQPQQQSNEPCKYLTQTQTLQVGCLNDQQYSLRTRLCYPNANAAAAAAAAAATSTTVTNDNNTGETTNSRRSYQQQQQTAYTQLESEINLVCLAHWRHHNGNQVIVSRTMSNEILCSIWSSSEDGRLLQLLEIDSNCNYDSSSTKKASSSSSSSHQRVNYGFLYIHSCHDTPTPHNHHSHHQQSSASSSSSVAIKSAFRSAPGGASSAASSSSHHHHHKQQQHDDHNEFESILSSAAHTSTPFLVAFVSLVLQLVVHQHR